MSGHGYVPYTRGCRCDVCRAAKAAYSRARRAEHRQIAAKHTRSSTGKRPSNFTARAPGATRYIAPIERHGTRFGYEEKGCRCFACTDARLLSDQQRRARRKSEAGETP